MKIINPAMLDLISQKLGNEPVNIIEVKWVENGNWYKYGDKNVTNYEFPIDGVIQEIGTLESVIKLDSQGQTNTIDIVLSDHKGDLKSIIDNHDIHGQTVRIYQWFETLPLSERFLLYEGEINSPITWNEGDRTLSFSAITQLADKEVGFSPEEGDFPFLPDEEIGKAWPLFFGTIQNVPAVQIFDLPVGHSLEDVGIVDPTLLRQLEKLRAQEIDLLNYRNYIILLQGAAAFICDFGGLPPDQAEQYCALAEQYFQTQLQINSQILELRNEISALTIEYQNQLAEEKPTVSISNGTSFPQGTPVTIHIGNAQLDGIFGGNTFFISNRKPVNYIQSLSDPTRNIVDEEINVFGFTFVKAGTQVSLQSNTSIIYIVSILECEVHSVQAYRRALNDDILTIVPSTWYEVKNVDIGGYNITYIEFGRPPSSHDETMQDDLYVTATSTVGPNTIDIIEWLITTYTDLEFDTVSFNEIKTKIDNYPSHFALLDRINIFSLLEDIAFQARCAIWISQGKFYMKYLSEEQDAVDNINEGDIDAGSLELFTTDTEELVTKLTANWTDNYAITEPNRIILRHNISKYGTRERDINFFIYNLPELVLKSATFWLIRFANMWKNIRFKTYLHKLPLETFDIINFNFNQSFAANTNIKGIMTNITYESNSQELNMEAWLPVKFGTMEPYIFAWPAQVDEFELFPTDEEIAIGYAGGDGPGEETSGEPLTRGRFTIEYKGDEDRKQRQDYGDEQPSDIGDEKPFPEFIGQNFSSIGERDPDDYEYGNYPFEPEEFETESGTGSRCYPGETVGTIGNDNMISVRIYKRKLLEDGEIVEVKQLDIAEDTDIPVGTWVLVMSNTFKEDPTNTDPDAELVTEYTMQVPVWL